MDCPTTAVVALIGYLAGSIPFAWLIGWVFGGVDIRKIGSGNAGASNLRRVPGCEKFYVPAILLDALKGLGAFYIARWMGLPVSWQLFCGFCAEVGHCYPVWLKFQGGKGVATFLGVALAANPALALVALATFVVLKKKKGYSSLASVVVAFVFSTLFSFMACGAGVAGSSCIALVGWVWLIFVLILWGHILNLNLIKLGYEPSSKQPRRSVYWGFLVHPTTDVPDYLKNYFVKKSQKFERLPNWFFNLILGPFLFTFLPAVFIRPATFWNREMRGDREFRRPSFGLVLPMPMGPSFMMRHQWFALWAISRLIRLAAMAGATHVGLGAYTAIVGDKGSIVRNRFEGRIKVTTGDEYTAYLAVDSIPLACKKMGKDITGCNLLVIGTGGVGSAAAMLAALKLSVARILLYNRTPEKAYQLKQYIQQDRAHDFVTRNIEVYEDLDEALAEADIIISATSSAKALKFRAVMLKRGAIVCDIARPRDFEVNRDDVLVYDGGMAACKGAQLPSLLGLPEELSFGCLFQTQALGSAREMEHVGSVGGEYDLDEILYIAKICDPCSDGVGALRNGDEGIYTDEQIAQICQAACAARGERRI